MQRTKAAAEPAELGVLIAAKPVEGGGACGEVCGSGDGGGGGGDGGGGGGGGGDGGDGSGGMACTFTPLWTFRTTPRDATQPAVGCEPIFSSPAVSGATGDIFFGCMDARLYAVRLGVEVGVGVGVGLILMLTPYPDPDPK